jgi:hypothetical protein
MGLRDVRAITVPRSVKRIDDAAFADCSCLRIVEFELPCQCWRLRVTAFHKCPLLEPIYLPPSIEFIDCEYFDPSRDRFPFLANGGNFLNCDNCLVRANGLEVIRCLGSSQTFRVNRAMTVLGAWSFNKCPSLTTLDFELPSRITHLLSHTFSHCIGLCFVTIPKSVRFIGESCFSGCTGLTGVVFESPSTVQRIEFEAFSNCNNLTSFTVPSSVSTLGNSVFY